MTEEYGNVWQTEMWKDKKSKKKSDAELIKNFRPGMDSSMWNIFWEWSEGSTLLFWRWPTEYRRSIRDGLEVFIQGELPDYWSRQRWSQDPEQQARPLKEKICKEVQRDCIRTGFVLSLTGFFAVAKDDGDI